MRGAVEKRALWLAIMPAAVLTGALFVAPAIWAIYISATPLSLLGPDAGSTRFVGLENYRRLFDDPDFAKYVRNTVVFTLGVAVAGATLGGLGVALIIDQAQRSGNRLGSIAFAAVVLAGVCPPALAGAIWSGMLDYRDGAVNNMIAALGGSRVDFLGNYPMLAVIIAESWRSVALGMLVFYGVLQSLPRSMFEAAALDGASGWQSLRDMTLPSIRHPMAVVLTITTIIASGAFILNELLTGGGTARQSETLALYAWHVAFTDLEIGFGAAISVVILAVTALLSAVYVWLVRSDQ